MRRAEENMDMMIFEYLEGNMSIEEQHDFEAQAAVDELLNEELELWQSSYITSEIPDTGVLENSLMHKPGPFASFTFYLNTILIVAVSFISNTQIEKDIEIINRLEVPSVAMVKKAPAIDFSNQELIMPAIFKVSIEDQNMAENREGFSFRGHEPISALSALPAEFDEYLIYPTAHVEIAKVLYSKTSSEHIRVDRKHVRYIRRMKNKAARQRRAHEFMKGDIPYVVPIDTRNF